MSITSVEPSNQICYIEKSPKPYSSAVNNDNQDQTKAGKTDQFRHAEKVGSKTDTGNNASSTVSSTTCLAPAGNVNTSGQLTGQLLDTTA